MCFADGGMNGKEREDFTLESTASPHRPLNHHADSSSSSSSSAAGGGSSSDGTSRGRQFQAA
jgi:hypothetical protein